MENNNGIRVRPAGPEDVPAMMALIRELAEFELQPGMVTVAIDHFLESGFGPQPVWWALVAAAPAEDGKTDVVVGMALYYIRYSTWRGQRMYLEDIVVTREARGKGIGTLLMNGLLATARSKGFSGISWQVLKWNEAAINFYRKYGAAFDAEWLNASVEL